MTKIIMKTSQSDFNNMSPEEKSAFLDKQQREARAERALSIADQSRQRVGETVGGRDLSRVAWPAGVYGYDHANQVSQLAVHILGSLQHVVPDDFELVRAAGLFPDLGRVEDWRKPDPNHAYRSAEAAEKLMATDREGWARAGFREEVCRLIVAHSLQGSPPNDPRLIALWDAECLESARLSPGTIEGMEIMKKRFDSVLSPWARLPEHQRRWRVFRGWK